MVSLVLKDLPIKDFNVGVASAISSYSRCRLWSLIVGIESKGKRVFMCDTDSVITDAKLNDYPDLMEEFMWDGCGDALGSLKNEADDHLKDCGHFGRSAEPVVLDSLSPVAPALGVATARATPSRARGGEI